MNSEWSLKELYTGLDDPKYASDIKKLEDSIAVAADFVKNPPASELEIAETILKSKEEISETASLLFNYLGFSQAVDTENGELMAQTNNLLRIMSKVAPIEAAADKLLAGISDIDALVKESEICKEYAFLLKENKEKAKHLLSDEVEEMYAAMDMTGGGAWGNLQSFLSSTLKVDYEGKVITLSEVRNLASDPDGEVRKKAYEAEIKAYEKIQDGIAFALNNIKNQVTMIAEKRGYESPIDMTLKNSRMQRETLDALWGAIDEYLPVFRKYMRHKAEMLGYKNGLPFYELFAPMGKSDKKYTTEEARDYLVNTFKEFSPDLSNMIQEAFDNSWIDFFPHAGKEGGAFCGGVPSIRQSRILTNFDGSFGAVDTLAHELGHAFHNVQLYDERPLNQDYPMPIAETASTFNEVFLGQAALKNASGDEKIMLIESELKEQNQVVVDIYSRYLFETAVFEKAGKQFLMADDLKKLMIEAQKATYGDGLDPEYMHPYMWCCKGHYYSSGLSFYNFPYAFGNLFAVGLYNLYLKEGESFVAKYKEMLRTTPSATMEECGAKLGIDLTKKDFWKGSLDIIASNIEEFCKL